MGTHACAVFPSRGWAGRQKSHYPLSGRNHAVHMLRESRAFADHSAVIVTFVMSESLKQMVYSEARSSTYSREVSGATVKKIHPSSVTLR